MHLIFLDMKHKAKQPRSQEVREDQGCEDDDGHHEFAPSLSQSAHRQIHSLLQLYSDQEESLQCS